MSGGVPFFTTKGCGCLCVRACVLFTTCGCIFMVDIGNCAVHAPVGLRYFVGTKVPRSFRRVSVDAVRDCWVSLGVLHVNRRSSLSLSGAQGTGRSLLLRPISVSPSRRRWIFSLVVSTS